MEKILALAKKLKALADRGIDGEKTTAMEMLQKFMTKHNITLDMINEDDTKEYTVKMEIEKYKFWRQVVASVIGNSAVIHYKRKDNASKKTYWITCTPSQYLEIEAKFSFFYNIYLQEENIFYKAFIQTQKLYTKVDNEDLDKEEKPLTTEEKQELWKMANMMAGMTRHHFAKQIKNG